MLTERGTSFGYNNLIVDFKGLCRLSDLGHPVVFDVTHSLQLPGAGDGETAGERRFAEPWRAPPRRRRRCACSWRCTTIPVLLSATVRRNYRSNGYDPAGASSPRACVGAAHRRVRRSHHMSNESSTPEDRMAKRPRAARESALALAREVLRIEAAALASLADRFDAVPFDRAIDIVLDCGGRVVVSGMGKSGVIGRKLAGTLASTGSPALFLHPAEAGHGDLGMLIEWRRPRSPSARAAKPKRSWRCCRRSSDSGVPLIGYRRRDAASTLAREADIALDAAVEKGSMSAWI